MCSLRAGVGGLVRQRAGHLARVAVGFALAGSVGCSSSGSTGPGTGNLTVTIAAPSGVTPAVTVHGPGGFSHGVSATTTLSGLTAGSYTVTAANARVANAIVDNLYAGVVTGSPVSITVGGTATVTAAYTLRPGSGAVWIGTEDQQLAEFTAAQLGSSSAAAPSVVLATSQLSNGGVTFDASGSLWAVTQMQNTIGFTANQLSTSATPDPATTVSLSTGAVMSTAHSAFDVHGNLWISDYYGNAVVELSAAQLAAGGTVTPAVTLSDHSGSLTGAYGLAFDAAGNLWVSAASGNQIAKFNAAQLTTSAAPVPLVVIGAASGSLNHPQGIAFDASGNLWVANAGGTTVVSYASSLLGASGSPQPTVTLTDNGGTLMAPMDLAFDASGNLWVVLLDGPVEQFTGAMLANSGTPAPNVVLTALHGSGPVAIAFDPSPANLPIQGLAPRMRAAVRAPRAMP